MKVKFGCFKDENHLSDGLEFENHKFYIDIQLGSKNVMLECRSQILKQRFGDNVTKNLTRDKSIDLKNET